MKNVSDSLMLYGEATRHIWNTYFAGKVKSLRECGALDSYEEIDKALFYAIVLSSIGKHSYDIDNFRNEAVPFLQVRARKGIKQLRMMIDEFPEGKYHKWSEFVLMDIQNDDQFLFIEFFDWDRYGYVAYPYYMACIQKFKKYPNLVGKNVLVETCNVQVMFCE